MAGGGSAVLVSGAGGVASATTEKPEPEYRDGQLVSATLESLVEMLRPGASPTFTFTFLLCSRLFLKPHELLSRLCKRYLKNNEKVVSALFIQNKVSSD